MSVIIVTEVLLWTLFMHNLKVFPLSLSLGAGHGK